MSCDIPYHVLSRIERLRGAGPIVLWIDLSGWWAVNSQVYPMLPPPAWGIEVPAEMWDKFLDKSGYFNFNVITIRDAMAGGGHLAPAAAYLRDARELVSARPQAAVAKCRHVLEAVEAALEIEGRPPNWAPLLESLAGNQRAKGYCKIIHGLKKVSSATHHDTSDEKDVSRAEGKALVLICEALVELLGAEAEE
ncbi:MAG: hypothetical protein OXM02_12725 [Bacteroidota bacterium]|nr:hypothetical protein [Bacteroidota bacterium]